jgi:Na+/glutamate symporter
MNNRFLLMLVSGIVGVGVISLVAGEIQWGLLIGLLVGISIAEWRTKEQENTGEVETDERVENNTRKFIISAFSLSNLLLLIYLVVCDMVLNKQVIEVRYLIYYLLATFVICFFIAPSIMKRR